MLSLASLFTLFLLATFASAQNVFTDITASTVMVIGQAYTITWTTDSSSTVTLTLRQGDASNLETVGTIAVGIPNTGSYTWYPDTSLPAGTDYALSITGDTSSDVNYSHYFAISGSSASSVSGSVSASGSTTSLPSSLVTDSTLSSTTSGSSGASGSSTASVTYTSSSSSGSSGSTSATSSGSSASAKSSASKTSNSIASASSSHSSANVVVSNVVLERGVLSIILVSLVSMVLCMM